MENKKFNIDISKDDPESQFEKLEKLGIYGKYNKYKKIYKNL